jgi:hypothetical protein
MDDSNSNNEQYAEAAAASLQLLLREDPGLLQLVSSTTNQQDKEETNSFVYAAELLNDHSNIFDVTTQARAEAALQDVERKLALTELLAVKLSRQSLEAVAIHLLKLHGHDITTTTAHSVNSMDASSSTINSLTLSTILDGSVRLEKTAESLEATAKRIEMALSRSLHRMQTATTKLQRCLEVSSTLKMVLRLQIETQKLAGYDLEDLLRDLTRAAASVAVLEELLNKFDDQDAVIAVVEHMRGPARTAGIAVRKAAKELIKSSNNYQTLGAVL